MPKYKRKSRKPSNYRKFSKSKNPSNVASNSKSENAQTLMSWATNGPLLYIFVIFLMMLIIYNLAIYINTKDDNSKHDNDDKHGTSNLYKTVSPVIIIIFIVLIFCLGLLIDYLLFGNLYIYRDILLFFYL